MTHSATYVGIELLGQLKTDDIQYTLKYLEITRNTWTYLRVKKMLENARSYISTLPPHPNLTCCPVFYFTNTRPNPTWYWKTLPLRHWIREETCPVSTNQLIVAFPLLEIRFNEHGDSFWENEIIIEHSESYFVCRVELRKMHIKALMAFAAFLLVTALAPVVIQLFETISGIETTPGWLWNSFGTTWWLPSN